MTDINPLNYVRGPVRLWIGAFGVTEPAQTNAALIADPGAGWTFLGATQGGCTWDDEQTVTGTRADQVVDEIGARITARKTTAVMNLLEATLANLAFALNSFGTTTQPGAGISVYTPGQMTSGSVPSYSALLLDGQAPQLTGGGAARRRVIFRKVLNTSAKVGQQYDPTKDALIPVTVQAYYVSSSIDPYVVMDQTS